MYLLTCRFDPARGGAVSWPWSPLFEIMGAAVAVVAAGLGLESYSGLVGGFGRPAAAGALQAMLLGAGWVIAAGRDPSWRPPVARLAAVVIAASLASHAHRWGAVVYLAVPVLLVREAGRRPAFTAIGLAWPGCSASALGLGAGAVLGLHLLVTASLTFGYGMRVGDLAAYVGAVAYDIGANALTAEWLFRGALFSRWWRESSFWPAAGASTICAVVRYLADPSLPGRMEVVLGAMFYLSLLGASACALRAATGSLLPGYAASLGFFLGYRALAQ